MRAVGFALLCLLTSLPVLATSPEIDAYVHTTMRERSIPGMALVITRDGKTVQESSYGVASLELQVPVTAATVFPIASVTKVFTATLVMQQVEAGKLALDSHVGDVIDSLPAAWRPVTVRQLLAHTSGLPDVIVNPMTGEWLAPTRAQALAKAAALPMQFEPGAGWSYNQTNYVLLGEILEKQRGKPIEQLVTDTILVPLAMKNTTFGDAPVVVAGRGPWYSRLDFSGPEPRLAKQVHATWVTYPDFTHTCAALNTTAAELARFVDRVAAGAVLKRATVETMWKAQTLNDGKPAGMDASSRMGLGWIVEDLNSHAMVGGSGGGSVAFRHAVAENVTIVVLTNCQGANPDGIATEILARTLGVAVKQ